VWASSSSALKRDRIELSSRPKRATSNGNGSMRCRGEEDYGFHRVGTEMVSSSSKRLAARAQVDRATHDVFGW